MRAAQWQKSLSRRGLVELRTKIISISPRIICTQNPTVTISRNIRIFYFPPTHIRVCIVFVVKIKKKHYGNYFLHIVVLVGVHVPNNK
jgi:hypothetical protein